MSKLTKLRKATSLSDLADILEMPPKSVSYILYIRPKIGLYSQFNIPKKTGGSRTISAPCLELKYLQKQLATLLQDCNDEIEKSRSAPSSLKVTYKQTKKEAYHMVLNPVTPSSRMPLIIATKI
ncbi:hypothetical protein JN403_24635 [Pseudomonas sp. 15A4]|uniref:hypothetical protein n=1 Tax=Pseudomonas sp. 15A4 TaxID=2804761 RepID=UPI0019682780|nr:hypothetical protein [Pseudomonas sp. 15A4]QSB19467.1 hypothetical protein JN403_24635 [Pseudomonas sp. 15A4]